MDRMELINTTRAILAKAGFDVSSALTLRGICFDIVARRDQQVLIIKVLSNIDAFSKENADEMKVLAESLGATPMVTGERSSSGALEPGIVYSRFNISIVSNETLADLLLDEAPPYIFAAPGGLYVRLDSEMLKAAREARGISLGVLAETAGVSRRTIQMYESGMGAMIDAALRMEEFLELPIIEPIDPFTFKSKERLEEQREAPQSLEGTFALQQLSSLGFNVRPVVRSPFEAVSTNDKALMLTSLGSDEEKVMERAIVASELSRIMDRFSVLIVEKKRERDNINNTAIVSNEELKKIDEPNELTDLVEERRTKR
ncbi:MAG: transcriptional regulator [Thermoplasmata archaeon]|nr:transcriptional regulator [Thermoplasmata archaeon]WII08129.1 transcriptional regulator [Methanomassiliicoccales archaeon LGM-RCC1]